MTKLYVSAYVEEDGTSDGATVLQLPRARRTAGAAVADCEAHARSLDDDDEAPPVRWRPLGDGRWEGIALDEPEMRCRYLVSEVEAEKKEGDGH